MDIPEKNTCQNTRLGYLDEAKGFGILLIMAGHVNIIDNPISKWNDSFKLTLFFLVSGILFKVKMNAGREMTTLSFRYFVIKRAKSLLLPYMVFSLPAMFFDIINTKKKYSMTAIEDLWKVCCLRGISTLWFLPTLFFGELFFFWFLRWNQGKRTRVLLMLGIPISLCIFCTYFSMWAVSNKMRVWYVFASPVILTIIKPIAAVWFLSMGFHLVDRIKKLPTLAVLLSGIAGFLLAQWNPYVDFNNLELGVHPSLFFINGLLGGAFIEIFRRFPGKRKLLRWFGRHSLFIMVTHAPFYITAVAFSVSNKIFGGNRFGSRYYLWWLVSLAVLCTIEAIMIVILQTVKRYIENMSFDLPVVRSILELL